MGFLSSFQKLFCQVGREGPIRSLQGAFKQDTHPPGTELESPRESSTPILQME